MPSLNRVILMGNLTRDPELRRTANDQTVCAFGLAVNRVYTDGNGERQQEVTFVDVTAWGRSGEVITQYLHKGDPILVEGRLRLNQWQDRETGANRSRLTVVAERFQFIGQRDHPAEAVEDDAAAGGAGRPAPPTPAAAPPAAPRRRQMAGVK